ncbi:MAG TPA: glycosyltransferase [Candidatus Polarisedimenticolaceae bacterium]|nr:glycosyltransferase [Candidatus Polarisedimenticolaceae bacterium]
MAPLYSGIPMRTVYVVLPVYNERERIGRLLERIDEAQQESALPYRIVLVDDGSRDGTAEIVAGYAARLPLTVRTHPHNLGLGATIRDGLVEAAGLAAPRDIVVTMDADDTHTPGLIQRMTRMISEGYDVVIASRYRPGSRSLGVPWRRRFVSYSGSWIFRLLLPIRGVKDYTCGYRAYRAEVIQDALAEYGAAFLDQDGFQCMVDILLKLRRRPLIFGEVPFVLRYDFKQGGSKMRVGPTIVNTLLLIARRLGRR